MLSEPAQDAATIRARSERQAMDWSLVLASQGIQPGIEFDAPTGSWYLLVEPSDHARAVASIRQYRVENRRFEWRQAVPGSDLTFHWGALLWVAVIAGIYSIQTSLERGLFDSDAVARGEWWRGFTAVWMHHDPGHLMMNALFGSVFLGLAMARFGPGLALLMGLISGAAGNYFGFVLRHSSHAAPLYTGLGSSGLVMGALGLLSAQFLPFWRQGHRGTKMAITGTATGAFLFLMLGTDPSGDILAHAGGFGMGLFLGTLAVFVPSHHQRIVDWVGGVLFLTFFFGTWYLAFR